MKRVLPNLLAAFTLILVLCTHNSVKAQSPGGTSTNLKLWLKAGTGVSLTGSNVTGWADQSPTTSNASTVGSSSTYPTRLAGVLNNNPVINFSGSSKALAGTFANYITSSNVTSFIVVKMQSASSATNARAFTIIRNNTGTNYDYNNTNSAILYRRNSTTDIGSYRNNTTLNSISNSMDANLLLSNSFGSNTFKTFRNGAQTASTAYTDVNLDSRYYTIGCSYESGYTSYMQGDIAEVILYAGALTTAEKNRVDSYLAMKYGFTLDQATTTNYVINGTTIAWNAANNSKLYNNNITGIGRSDGSGLNQLKSKTINADSIVTISAASFPDDNSYFFIGDNGTSGTATGGAITTFSSRALRTWNVQTTGTVPEVTLTVDLRKAGVSTPYGGFSTSTVRLLLSSIAGFTSATPITPTSVEGNIATFTIPSGQMANGSFFTIGLVPAAGYIYLHNKVLNEEESVNFNYTILGGTSSVSSVSLNDTSSLLNVLDLGGSHGHDGENIGNGQLWAVAKAPGSVTPTIQTSTASSPHNNASNNPIYMRPSGGSGWVSTGQSGFTLDGADYNTMVFANVAGSGFFYTIGGSANTIYNITNHPLSKLKDIAYGGGTTVAVNGSGHILVYNGTYANNSDSWTDISGSNTSMVAERIDILPSTGKIVFQNSSGDVSTVNSNGTGLVSIGKAAGTGTPNVRDVCFDDNGNIYASLREPISGNDHVYDYIGSTWTLNPQSRICNSLTGTAGNQVWGVNFQDGSGQNAIFTRTTDGSRTWLNDERVRVGLNDNSAMIAVMPGTYAITEQLPDATVWDLNNVTIYDPSPNSNNSSVAGNRANVIVSSGETVHIVFTNEKIVLTTIANSCDVQNLQEFGSGSSQYGAPVVGSTSYHYTASVTPQDGLYTIEKNAVGLSNWWIQGTQFINGDHTTGPGGNGYFMLINASYGKDEFFRQRVRGLIIGQEYQLSIWAANVSVGTQINPNILFGIADINSGSTMGSLSTGEITHGYWTQYTFFFTATKTTADIFLRNNAIGGNGNDLVIDDISLNLPPSSFAQPISGSSIVCSNTLSSFTYTTPSSTGVWSLSNNLLGVLSNPTASTVTFTPAIGATGTCTITYTITTGACVSSVTKDVTLDNNCTIGTRTIGGTVFNDKNGLVDNTVNGTGTNGGGVNAVIYNNTTGKIQAIMAVPSTGVYSFSGLPNNNNYSVILTAATYVPGTTLAKPTSTLPTNYGSVGENYTTAAGSDGNANGILDLGIVSTNVNQADFGIEQKPTANAASKTTTNPGGTTKVVVPTLTGSDPEEGTYNGTSLTNKIQIQSLPDFGTLYYNGALVSVGQEIPSYEPSLLTVDPNNGSITGTFTFSEIDSAGLVSDPAIVTMTFTALSISGNIWDDGNGNAVRDGVEPFITNGSVWVNLVNSSNDVLQSVLVDNAGNYTLVNANQNTTYNIILTSTDQSANTNLTTSSLPSGWKNTGVNLSGAADTDNQTGKISVSILTANITAQNFAIEQTPTTGSGGNTATNPGGTASTTVPANTFTNTTLSTDADGTVTSIRITALPTGATSITINNVIYTSITFPVGGITVPTDASGNPTQVISVDPSFTGVGTVNIPFVAIDNAGKESATGGIAAMTFTAFTISGNVWDDANGNAIKDGVEPFIINGSVWVNLVNPTTHDVIQSVVVNASGDYLFANVLANTAYDIILSTTNQISNPSLTAATVPAGFANTGVNLNGIPNSANQAGIINVTTGTTILASQNFGIEKLPTAGAGSSTTVNLGGTASSTVPANTFTNTTLSADVDGNVASIKIANFPTGATSITINGTTYTSANFPAAGVTIPTDASGNPTQTISVDPSFTGAGSVAISFVAIDNAGKESANTGTATINFTALTVSGSVWDDANGNAIKDGAEPFIITGNTVWANLVDPATHLVLQSVVVNNTGTYTFSGVPANTNYEVILTNSLQAANASLTLSTLPAGFGNTGTNLGGTASTTNQTGVITITTGATSLASQNFGIEKLPIAGTGSNTAVNPGGTASTVVPANTFTNTTVSSDADGNVASILITTFPTGATSITINGTTYTSTNFPAAGVTIPADASGNPTQTISIDPSFTGAGSVAISFMAIDNAGKESANPGTATMNFTALTVSGSVWDDPNGNAVKDGGEPFIITGNTVWANLVDPATHQVLQSAVVNASGIYTFSGVPANTAYEIILTNSSQAVNASLTASSLPAGFANTGTNLSGTANTTNQTGVATVTTAGVSLGNQNFGIEKLPIAGNGANSAINPGSTTSVTVPANTFTNGGNSTDADGSVTSIRITTFPTGATSITINGNTYTSATFPAAGVTVPTNGSGSPTQTISVDPSFSDAGSISISFVAIDNAGKESSIPGAAIMTFTGVTVSGNVWNDTNGNAVKTSGEPFITNGSVFVNLVDPVTHDVIQSVVVDASGNYSFTGVAASNSYEIILSSTSQAGNLNLVSSTLPAGFANTGTNLSGTANTTNQTGVASVTVGASGLSAQNFGIEQLPTAGSGSNSAVNLGGTASTTVPASTFVNTTASSDPDGNVASIRIITFPTDATSITINGTTYTSANFPAAGVIVPTNTSGSPTQTITIDPSFTGTGSVTISFVAIDNAGKESTNIGTATMTFTALTVSGNVWDDVNGNAVKEVSESFITNGSVFANLVDPATHDVIQSVAVDASGNYSFSAVPANTTYQIILSNSSETGNLNLIASTLPTGFANTGTNLGGTASTTNQTGIISVTTGATSLASQNFGIELLPTAGAGSNTAVNLGGTASTVVPASTFTNTTLSSDVDGNVASIRITTFPTGATSITINGTTYTSANFPIAGVTVPTDASGNPTQTISVDPSFAGAGSVTISFVAIDNAGKESANTGTATMNFTALTVSGNVWDDANGNAVKEVAENYITDGSVFANLVNPTTHDVIQSVAVDASGNYSFSGVPANTTYQIILSNSSQTGNLNLTASTLPAGFANTGTNIGGTASTANSTGVISVTTGATSLASQNFGIELLPIAGNGGNSAINPGGTTSVAVPANTFTNGAVSTDADGNVASIKITTFPTGATSITINGTTYTSGNFPAAGVTIPTDANGNPTQAISIDPSFSDAGSITINFVAIDNAGKESNIPGAAVMTFTGVTVSGSVWNDTNGNAVKTGGEPFITNGSVFVNLVDPITHDVIQSVVVDASGNYSFTGVAASSNYEIILTTSNQVGNLNLVSSTLPAGFANTGTNLNGTANTTNQTGVASVTVGNAGLTAQNFGIEQLPTAGNGSNSTVNPGGTASATVPASTFTNGANSTDPDGNVASIKITTFPADANSITINGTTYTSANFPATGVTIPTNTSGSPTQTITVDPSFTGSGTITISFVAIDNAGKESTNLGTATMNFIALTVSGNVWDDANGNAIPDGGEAFITNGNVYANLVDPATHDVIESVVLDASGNYTFSGVSTNTSYQIILSAGNEAGNTNLAASTLPTNWVSTGTNIGGTASTANQTGIIAFTTGSSSLASQNFGIELLPNTGSGNNTTLNPGGTNSANVPANTFTNTALSSDVDGNVIGIRITAFPANATSITIDGTTYRASVPGQVNALLALIIPTSSNGTPTPSISIDPSFGGVGSVVINFVAIDNADKESLAPGTATVNFTDLTISGHVYDDLNGVTDGLINGTPVNIASGQQLYANLVDHASGTVVGSVAVAANGTYTLGTANGLLPNTNYDVVLSMVQNSATSTLPSGWVSTAEGSGLGDGNINGIVVANIGTTNVSTNVDFGLDQTPITNPVTATFVNPGGSVTVPPLNGSDPEQGLFPGTGNSDTIIIRTLPTKGDLYYNDVLVVAGDTIKNYNPALLILDPTAGVGIATFTYSEVDAALKTSTAPSTVKLTISAPNLSPLITFLPSTVVGATNVSVVARIKEFNRVATSGLITVYIPKDNRYVLNYNPTATTVGGFAVANSIWNFDKTSNPSFYILTTNSIIPQNGTSNFGFTTMVNPNNAVGQFRISIIILDYSGGELGSDAGDNADDDILIYKY